ncbi:TPA: YSIRK-type signal peptide-containing protein [Streptococcus pyogenes]|nr:YSIRK-type signal peptide-containing protein [Streptococcus pyogenes]
MARQQTKKNYSLRKLKTGTASVAVALTVLGAGFANQTEVRADQAVSGASVNNGASKRVESFKYDALRGENADLRNVNAKYLEKINAEEEKAELQAKLDAQGKALKEQLAKQTEELAKLRAEKAAGSKTPATKTANKERSGRAAQTATRPSQNKGMRSQLPSTGEAANPFFTAAAATVMVSAGMLALKRKEEN